MKLKHWMGYGCVNAKKMSLTPNKLVVKVEGMHECGLDCDDKYHIFNWLVRRFDKKRKDWIEISNIHTEYNRVIDKKGYPLDTCLYTITFN